MVAFPPAIEGAPPFAKDGINCASAAGRVLGQIWPNLADPGLLPVLSIMSLALVRFKKLPATWTQYGPVQGSGPEASACLQSTHDAAVLLVILPGTLCCFGQHVAMLNHRASPRPWMELVAETATDAISAASCAEEKKGALLSGPKLLRHAMQLHIGQVKPGPAERCHSSC